MTYEENFIALMEVTCDETEKGVEMAMVLEKPYALISIAGYPPRLWLDLSEPDCGPVKAVENFSNLVSHVMNLPRE